MEFYKITKNHIVYQVVVNIYCNKESTYMLKDWNSVIYIVNWNSYFYTVNQKIDNMRSLFIMAFFMGLFSGGLYAQDTQIEEGAIFMIEDVENDNYEHINFPEFNFIIKQGGVPHYAKVRGQEVVITSIKERKDGSQVATIKLTSEKFFFNSHKYVTVDIGAAIAANELRAL